MSLRTKAASWRWSALRDCHLVVLAVGVVVAVLGARELVARQDHRGAAGKEQRRQHVAHLPEADRADVGVVGRAFGSVVVREVVGVTVAVLLAVRLVVLVVVGDEVVEREAVMGGEEVHRCPRLAAALVEQVRGGGDARGEVP